MTEVELGQTQTDQREDSSVDMPILSEMTKDFSNFLDMDASKERQVFYDSIEEMLTKLDEFGAMVDAIRGDTRLCLNDTVPKIQTKCEEMKHIFSRVDQLEVFVNIVKKNVNMMEELVNKAENEMGSFSGIKKMFSSIVGKKSSYQRDPTKQYDAPDIFITEEFLRPNSYEEKTEDQSINNINQKEDQSVTNSNQKEDQSVNNSNQQEDQSVTNSNQKEDQSVTNINQQESQTVTNSNQQEDQSVTNSNQKEDQSVTNINQQESQTVTNSNQQEDQSVTNSNQKEDQSVTNINQQESQTVTNSNQQEDQSVTNSNQKEDQSVTNINQQESQTVTNSNKPETNSNISKESQKQTET